jgi:hypothetical protein
MQKIIESCEFHESELLGVTAVTVAVPGEALPAAQSQCITPGLQPARSLSE